MKNINQGYDCNAPIRDAADPDVSLREYNDRLLELRMKRLEQEISKTGGGPQVGSVEEHNKRAEQWKKLHPGR
jgi:hypothetical protein